MFGLPPFIPSSVNYGPGSYAVTVPDRAATMTVSLQGGGGGASSNSTNAAGGGGAGRTSHSWSVSGLASKAFTLTVGAGGGHASAGGSTTLTNGTQTLSAGGGQGAPSTSVAGLGGGFSGGSGINGESGSLASYEEWSPGVGYWVPGPGGLPNGGTQSSGGPGFASISFS